MNTLTLKVGQMPGKLVEVIVERGLSAREIFEIAEVSVSNHEVRLDGNKVDMDTRIESGALLVAMKQIKGNAKTIKCGLMPGKLQVIEYEEGETARNVFNRAGIDLSNHEIRLDGNKIDLDSDITNGTLLVGMKMIKGNVEQYVSSLTEREIEILLNVKLPTILPTTDVMQIDDETVLVLDNVIDADMFDSVYTLTEINNNTYETQTYVEVSEEPIHECRCNKGKEFVESKLKELKEQAEYYWREYRLVQVQFEILEEVLKNM